MLLNSFRYSVSFFVRLLLQKIQLSHLRRLDGPAQPHHILRRLRTQRSIKFVIIIIIIINTIYRVPQSSTWALALLQEKPPPPPSEKFQQSIIPSIPRRYLFALVNEK